MFGTYRTVLALLVVLQHLGGVAVIGTYAVFGFYILSGYLMTAIMHQSYGYTTTGIAKYAVNRFLRIYPIYWVSALFTLLLIYVFGSAALSEFHEAMRYPATLNEAIKNTLILFPDLSSARLTPPSWALTVELFFYVLIGFGLSRHYGLVVAWFAGSVAYHITAALPFFPWSETYFSFAAASLPFSTGALIFFHQERLRTLIDGCKIWFVAALTICFLLNYLAMDSLITRTTSFYISYLICALLVVCLVWVEPSSPLKNMDKWLGDLSYPIYLIHFQVGFVVLWFFEGAGVAASEGDSGQFTVMVILIVLVSWLVMVGLQAPIDSLRNLVRRVGSQETDQSVSSATK